MLHNSIHRVFQRTPVASRRSQAYLLCVVALLTVSCGMATKNISTIEVASPDQQWSAIGKTDQTSGPGNADISTEIDLKRLHAHTAPETILLFQNQPVSSGHSITFDMIWLTPTHLEVTFNRIPDFYAQTIKYAGVEITVKQVAQ